jgi:CheY-like chemotaxis protein
VATHTAVTPLASRHIMVVDDETSILDMLETALTGAGARVTTAMDGETALVAITRDPPDLILLDVKMPGMDGWDLLDRLAGAPRTARIPVALQTCVEDFVTFDKARREGVAAFISKPFRVAEVVETCRRILSGSRPLQGTPPPDDESPSVQIRDAEGNLVAFGFLIDLDERGAQIDASSPLPLGQSIRLELKQPDRTVEAEVRWVTSVGGRYQHGLVLRPRPVS